MRVQFIHPNPRSPAQPVLNRLLAFGEDQLAIACAFLTMGGAKVLQPHIDNLLRPSSFIVVSSEIPTSEEALNVLFTHLGAHLYVHLGSKTPVEIGVGRGIMHSKVFYARNGKQCMLWVGSHNLTASAMHGVNCEAAVLVEGDANEQVFQDALQHLEAVRDEATPYDGQLPDQVDGEPVVLVIHAETEERPEHSPWFSHFRPASTELDSLLRPGGPVWLYLYSPGTLISGEPLPHPKQVFSGTITAMNMTPTHPQRGISAEWRDADYVIEQVNSVFRMVPSKVVSDSPTQAVFRIERLEPESTVWLAKKPSVVVEGVADKKWNTPMPPGTRSLFTPSSIRGGAFWHQLYTHRRKVLKLPDVVSKQQTSSAALQKLELPRNIPVQYEKSARKGIFQWIYRAVFRLDS